MSSIMMWTHCYGNPNAVTQGTEFYRLMSEGLDFQRRVILRRLQSGWFICLELGHTESGEGGLHLFGRAGL